MTKTGSGVDASTIAAIQFPQTDGRVLHGTLTTGLTAQTTPGRVVVAYGTLGYLEIHWCVLVARLQALLADKSTQGYLSTDFLQLLFLGDA